MTTTTSYGTWSSRINTYENSPEDGLNAYLGDADPADYDMDAIYAAYRRAIDEALPGDVSLCGNEFIGPAYPEDGEFDGYLQGEDGALDFAAIIEDLDFDTAAAFERYELIDIDEVADRLGYSGKSAAATARKTLARWGVEAAQTRPHPESNRLQHRYLAGEVEGAARNRPGQGARADLTDPTA